MQMLRFSPIKMVGLIGIIVSILLLIGYSNIRYLTDISNALFQDIDTQQADRVFPDYEQRDAIINSYETNVREHPDSFFFLRLLSAQYLRRFREKADLEDLRRVEETARQSIALQPQNNTPAELLLASTLLSQHRFQEASQVMGQAQKSDPDNPRIIALNASIQMELGHYEAAQILLNLRSDDEKIDKNRDENSGQGAVLARYLELTGQLDLARSRLDLAMQDEDRYYTNSAETRAWFHVRSGDLAFATGDFPVAEKRYQEARKLFPADIAALTGLARLYAAQHRWKSVLEVANQGIDRIPLVETLGYKADAQRALGNPTGAADTEALIDVVAHLSQVKGIYDRALAIYYVEHQIHLPEALTIARQEVRLRDDIYAEDTLAWAAAANGQWQEAETAALKSARYGTEDALLNYHQGVIAQHAGHREVAVMHLQQALHRNAKFHSSYADDARQRLADLKAG